MAFGFENLLESTTLLLNADFQAHLNPVQSESLGKEPEQSIFQNIFQVIVMTLVETYEPWHYVFLKGLMEDSSVSSTSGYTSGKTVFLFLGYCNQYN